MQFGRSAAVGPLLYDASGAFKIAGCANCLSLSRACDARLHRQSAKPRKVTALERPAMTDDSKKTALDRKLVSLEQDYEVRDGSKRLVCTPDEVKAVGNFAVKVREHLAEK